MRTTILLAVFSIFAFVNTSAAAVTTAHSSLASTPMPEGLRDAVDRTLWRDEAHAARLRSAIEHSRARNTIVDAQSWTGQDVTASDGAIDDRFGTSVAVSGDTAVVGAADAKIGDNYYQGAAYVFAKQDGVWTEIQKLVASDGAGMADFGTAVAIAGDTILISAISANVGGNSNQGAVYVFGQSGGVWTQTQKLAADDGGSGDAFGNAIATNGSTALIAAKGATINGNTLQGKVYVFSASGGAWTQSQALMADDGASNDLFGSSLAIDGDVAIIGAPTLTYNFLHAGWAYVFTNSSGTWTQGQKIIPDNSAVGDQFGAAVGLAGDTALITSTGNQFAFGAAYVFKNTAGSWSQTQQLAPGDGASGDEFGNVLAMSGTSAVIGAQRLVLDGHQGAAYVFSAADGVWSQTQEFTEASGTSLDFFGGAVAFDGTTVVIGTPGATVNGEQFQGSASFYTASGGEPVITVTPGSLSSEQAADTTATKVLTIGNTGTGDLTWNVTEADPASPDGCAAASTDLPWLAANPNSGTTAAAGSTDVQVAFDSTGLAAGEYDGLLCIASNDANQQTVPIAVTLTVTDSSTLPVQEVTASDGTGGDEFGISAVVEGDTALVGAAYENSGQGAVYVFTESNGVWSEAQKLTASDGAANDWFGQSVALDGDTAVIGAPQYLNVGNGAAYVFTRSGTSWNFVQKLTADDGVARDQFGISVAVDGTNILVGAYGTSFYTGAAYVFVNSGSAWTQTQKLAADDAAMNADFGVSVALEGTTALIGAYGDSSYQGAAYIFADNGGTWSQAQRLVASDGAADAHFGISVALDGSNALVGAEGATVGGNSHQGAAYALSASGGNWAETQKLTSDNGVAWDYFGRSVALDGATAIVGAYGPNALQGAAYLFSGNAGAWSETQALVASDGAGGDQYGIWVALSGPTALVGANGANSFQGAAYFYTLPTVPPDDVVFQNGFDP